MTLDDLRNLEKKATPVPWGVSDDLALLFALRNAAPALIACAEALQNIAAFNDVSASQHLRLCGSYHLFDEPNSVRIAREALRRLEQLT